MEAIKRRNRNMCPNEEKDEFIRSLIDMGLICSSLDVYKTCDLKYTVTMTHTFGYFFIWIEPCDVQFQGSWSPENAILRIQQLIQENIEDLDK